MSNKITHWTFEGVGEHHGHTFVKDKWGIDFFGHDPDTSYWCLDCKKSITVTDAKELPEESEADNENTP